MLDAECIILKMAWLTYFIISLLISFFAVSFLVQKYKKTQKKFLYRLGGAGIIIAFVISVVINSELVITKQIWAMIVGSLLILVFGFWDDLKSLGWKSQLAFQIFLALLLVFSGYVINYIINPFGGLLRLDAWQVNFFGQEILILSSVVVLLWTVLIINSLNWADGIDGLSGGIAILAAISIFFVSLRTEVNQPAMAILALILTGSVLGFWIWNFPAAKIEGGSSGSYFLGFVLSALAIMAGTKIATTLIILAIPVMDAAWVIFERAREGKWPMYKEEGKRHLHYKLRSLGLGDRKILLLYLGFSFLMMIISMFISGRQEKLALLLLEVIAIMSVLFFLFKKGRHNDPV